MNRYNPYLVPDNFFEDVRKDALTQRSRTRRNIGLAAGAFLTAALIMASPYVFDKTDTDQVIATEQMSDALAEMYSYDIFLQVANF